MKKERILKEIKETLNDEERSMIFADGTTLVVRGEKCEVAALLSTIIQKVKSEISKEQMERIVEVGYMTEEEITKEVEEKINKLSEIITKSLKDLLGELEDGNSK